MPALATGQRIQLPSPQSLGHLLTRSLALSPRSLRRRGERGPRSYARCTGFALRRPVKSIYIKDMEAAVDNGKIRSYRINARISLSRNRLSCSWALASISGKRHVALIGSSQASRLMPRHGQEHRGHEHHAGQSQRGLAKASRLRSGRQHRWRYPAPGSTQRPAPQHRAPTAPRRGVVCDFNGPGAGRSGDRSGG